MRVYFYGILVSQDDTDTLNWSRATKFDIPAGTKVLGIECLDLGGLNGIRASTIDGLVTDGSWLCSSNQNVIGWAEPEFKDTNGDFSAASTSAPKLMPQNSEAAKVM